MLVVSSDCSLSFVCLFLSACHHHTVFDTMFSFAVMWNSNFMSQQCDQQKTVQFTIIVTGQNKTVNINYWLAAIL